jgi:HTH-type transcriptional regulator / antitoxin HigA
MRLTQTQFDIEAIQSSWLAFSRNVVLRPIQTEADYKRMAKLMNSILNIAGDDEDHPLSGLLDLVGELVSKYEQTHHAIKASTPNETLLFLMEARGLKQDDLSAIVAQSNLSAILAGKRKISAALAGKLGQFFGVSAALFVPR